MLGHVMLTGGSGLLAPAAVAVRPTQCLPYAARNTYLYYWQPVKVHNAAGAMSHHLLWP